MSLHCVSKDFFAVVEDSIQSSWSEHPGMLTLGLVLKVAIQLLNLVVYRCLNGWRWFLGLRARGKKEVLGNSRRLGGRERMGLDAYGGLRQPGRLTREYR